MKESYIDFYELLEYIYNKKSKFSRKEFEKLDDETKRKIKKGFIYIIEKFIEKGYVLLPNAIEKLKEFLGNDVDLFSEKIELQESEHSQDKDIFELMKFCNENCLTENIQSIRSKKNAEKWKTLIKINNVISLRKYNCEYRDELNYFNKLPSGMAEHLEFQILFNFNYNDYKMTDFISLIQNISYFYEGKSPMDRINPKDLHVDERIEKEVEKFLENKTKNNKKEISTYEFIYYVYYVLNKNVSYSPTYRVAEESKYKNRIEYKERYFPSIFNGKREEIKKNMHGMENNEIICTSWAEEFYVLLLKYSRKYIKRDLNVRIIDEGHKYVEILEDNGNIVVADATKSLDGSMDILNCKVGLNPKGIYIDDGKSAGTFEKIKLFKKIDDNLRKSTFINYLISLFNQFYYKENTNISFETRIKYIQTIMHKHKGTINGYEAYRYYIYLCSKFLSKEDRNNLQFLNIIMKNGFKTEKRSLLVYANEDEKKTYIVFNNTTLELETITIQDLKEGISGGIIGIIADDQKDMKDSDRNNKYLSALGITIDELIKANSNVENMLDEYIV